jgi:hypothetical protein
MKSLYKPLLISFLISTSTNLLFQYAASVIQFRFIEGKLRAESADMKKILIIN